MTPWWGSRAGTFTTSLGVAGVLVIGGLAYASRPAATQQQIPLVPVPTASASASASAASVHLAALAKVVSDLGKVQAAANTSLASARTEVSTLRTVASTARTHLKAERTAHTTRPQNCAVVGASRTDVAADLTRARALATSISGRATAVLASMAGSKTLLTQGATELAAATKAGATRGELSSYTTALQTAPISRTAIETTATANQTSATTLTAQLVAVDQDAAALLAQCFRQTSH